MAICMILENVAAETADPKPATVSVHSRPGCNPDSAQFHGSFENDAKSVSLEKSWHGIHYLLTGDPWAGIGLRGFLIHGGRYAGVAGNGPVRIFAPHEVKEIAKLLRSISSADLWSNYDQERFQNAAIYPDIWDESEFELREEYIQYFEMLKQFVSRTAEDGNSLQISLV